MTDAVRKGGAGARRRLLLGAALLAALVSAGQGRAATIPVSNGDQLQAAVRDAHAGDTIVLAPGVYAPDAPLEFTTDVTIAGPSAEAPRGGQPGAVISGGNVDG